MKKSMSQTLGVAERERPGGDESRLDCTDGDEGFR